jgi:hypothetical protein
MLLSPKKQTGSKIFAKAYAIEYSPVTSAPAMRKMRIVDIHWHR